MREKGQNEVAKTLETPVFSRGIEILTEKKQFSGKFGVDKCIATWYDSFIRKGKELRAMKFAATMMNMMMPMCMCNMSMFRRAANSMRHSA